MTRTFTVDARYRRYIESSLAMALDTIRHDQKRRDFGDYPIIADVHLDLDATGDVAAFVGEAPTIQAVADVLLTAGATP